MTSLYWSQTSPIVLYLPNRAISTRITCLYGCQTSSVVFGCKTATSGTELHVSVGQRPHLWVIHAKMRLAEQNNMSLWVPDMICRFVHVQQRT